MMWIAVFFVFCAPVTFGLILVMVQPRSQILRRGFEVIPIEPDGKVQRREPTP